MLMPILIGLAVVVVVFVIVVATRPDDFRVTRSATIAAPPAAVFEQVNDFHKWDAWSPWAKIDPACKNAFEGAAAGKGAMFAWDGNKKVGAGRMTVTDSQRPELIRINLEFLRPFKASNTTEFTFNPAGKGTTVTWNMSGKNNFMSKAFGLFVNCDNLVGKDFEKGLASLKAIVEATARAQP
jgi:uncharacterized protein YndB with AHSA1/START domain